MSNVQDLLDKWEKRINKYKELESKYDTSKFIPASEGMCPKCGSNLILNSDFEFKKIISHCSSSSCDYTSSIEISKIIEYWSSSKNHLIEQLVKIGLIEKNNL